MDKKDIIFKNEISKYITNKFFYDINILDEVTSTDTLLKFIFRKIFKL